MVRLNGWAALGAVDVLGGAEKVRETTRTMMAEKFGLRPAVESLGGGVPTHNPPRLIGLDHRDRSGVDEARQPRREPPCLGLADGEHALRRLRRLPQPALGAQGIDQPFEQRLGDGSGQTALAVGCCLDRLREVGDLGALEQVSTSATEQRLDN
jgi:hypothetical protein